MPKAKPAPASKADRPRTITFRLTEEAYGRIERFAEEFRTQHQIALSKADVLDIAIRRLAVPHGEG